MYIFVLKRDVKLQPINLRGLVPLSPPHWFTLAANRPTRSREAESPNLEIGADRLLALLALVGEQVLVARYAERLVVSQDVAMSGQIQRAVEARQHTDALYRRLHHSPTRAAFTFFSCIEINTLPISRTATIKYTPPL